MLGFIILAIIGALVAVGASTSFVLGLMVGAFAMIAAVVWLAIKFGNKS